MVGHKKTTNNARVIFHPYAGMPPTVAIVLHFGVWGDIPDVITHAKFHINWFGGFGVLTPPNLAISIGLDGRSYNSVSTAVLHFDKHAVCLLREAYYAVITAR